MRNKFIRGAAVVVICLLSAKIVKEQLLTPKSLRLYVGILLLGISLLRLLITKRNKIIVLNRRRLIKDMRRRAYLVDSGKAKWESVIKKDEELILQFLGNITVSNRTTVIFILGIGIALILKWDLIALVFTLGHLFLAIEFYFEGTIIKRRLPPDDSRNYPNTSIRISANENYDLKIDLGEVKSFTILPPGTVFWDNQQVINWLKRCGFKRNQDETWHAKGTALKALDDAEIVSINLL